MLDGNPLQIVSALMAVDTSAMDPRATLAHIASLVDAAGDAGFADGLDRAEALLDELAVKPAPPAVSARSHYCRANLWAHRHELNGGRGSWAWSDPVAEAELLELRRCVRHTGFSALGQIERAQALTNLANRLNSIGRFVEAVEVWDRALKVEPRLAMARGNRGVGLTAYARALYDDGHQAVLLAHAWRSLRAAAAADALIETEGLEPAFEQFSRYQCSIENYLDPEVVFAGLDLTAWPLGRSSAEQRYRSWCLDHRLFLNPLNDLGAYPLAARDVLTLPTITTPLSQADAPAIIRFFNVLKQEYVSARYTFYEGDDASRMHFSDREVLLYNTLDYPALGLAVERVKTAYRAAYSIFDKTAFLLNNYLELGHAERQITFRTVWYRSARSQALHPKLDGLANWPLRGLFWLSRDIFEAGFQAASDPDAEALHELRNHLEHKFVTVHSEGIGLGRVGAMEPGLIEITYDDLSRRTVHILKLARAALLYVSLAVHSEEERRRANDREAKLSVPVPLHVWEDRWKHHF